MFNAILLTNDADQFHAGVHALDDQALPMIGAHDVTMRVEYSTINYKDALAITNQSPVVRKWPMVAGIDGAGIIESSNHPNFKAGDRVILNGWGLGENHWGCLAQKARLSGDWPIALPPSLTTKQAMAIGTAGYTAMLCVLALEYHGITPHHGEILVTGASGGVGSVAIALLAKLGYTVVASTAKLAESDYLKSLGAAEVIDRTPLSVPNKPLQKERWAGAIDSIGSYTLANICAQMKCGGVVAACGLAQGIDFPGSVAPFILRGMTLVGVNSVMTPRAHRITAWNRLARDLDPSKLNMMTYEIGLEDVFAVSSKMMAGKVRGRLVVDVNRTTLLDPH